MGLRVSGEFLGRGWASGLVWVGLGVCGVNEKGADAGLPHTTCDATVTNQTRALDPVPAQRTTQLTESCPPCSLAVPSTRIRRRSGVQQVRTRPPPRTRLTCLLTCRISAPGLFCQPHQVAGGPGPRTGGRAPFTSHSASDSRPGASGPTRPRRRFVVHSQAVCQNKAWVGGLVSSAGGAQGPIGEAGEIGRAHV